MSKRAALYIRVSSDEQARHGLSLGEQKADLLRYAKEHNYVVVDIYADEGATARKDIKKRKEFQRLLADIAAGRIDLIIIKCLDRWSRNIADFYEVQKFLDEHEVFWECTQEKYNTTTASGRLYMNIRMSIAQDESDRTSERIKYVFAGKKERKEVITGIMPFGYSIVDKHAVPNDKAPIVRFMFEQIIKGASTHSLSGAVYKNFGEKVQCVSVKRILRNRAYIGEMYGISDFCEPIVAYDVFKQVQELLSKNRKAEPSGRIYLFVGLIRCPDCNAYLHVNIGRKSKDGEYKDIRYRCYRHYDQPALNLCSFSRSISEKRIEEYLLDNILALFAKHKYQTSVEEEQYKQADPEGQLEIVKSKISRLRDIYLDGLIEKSDYEKEYVKLRQQSDELSVKIEKSRRLNRITPLATLDGNRFREVYENLSREEKRNLWRSLISEMTFEDTPQSRGRNGVFSFKVKFL